MPNIMTSDEDASDFNAAAAAATQKTFKVFRRKKGCPVHDYTFEGKRRPNLKLTPSKKMSQNEVQKTYMAGERDGGIISASPTHVRKFNKTVNFAGSAAGTNPMMQAALQMQ